MYYAYIENAYGTETKHIDGDESLAVVRQRCYEQGANGWTAHVMAVHPKDAPKPPDNLLTHQVVIDDDGEEIGTPYELETFPI